MLEEHEIISVSQAFSTGGRVVGTPGSDLNIQVYPDSAISELYDFE